MLACLYRRKQDISIESVMEIEWARRSRERQRSSGSADFRDEERLESKVPRFTEEAWKEGEVNEVPFNNNPTPIFSSFYSEPPLGASTEFPSPHPQFQLKSFYFYNLWSFFALLQSKSASTEASSYNPLHFNLHAPPKSKRKSRLNVLI